MASMRVSFGEEAIEKLKEVGWFVAVSLLRWLLEQVVGGNPGGGDDHVDPEQQR